MLTSHSFNLSTTEFSNWSNRKTSAFASPPPEAHDHQIRSLLGGLGIHSRGKTEQCPSTTVSKLHQKETRMCSEKSSQQTRSTEAQLPPTTSAPRADPVGSFSAPSGQGTNPSAKSKRFSDSLGYWISPPGSQIKCQLMKEEHREWPVLLVASSYLFLTFSNCFLKPFSTT